MLKFAAPVVLRLPAVPKVAISIQFKSAVKVLLPSNMFNIPVPIILAVSSEPLEVIAPTPYVPVIPPEKPNADPDVIWILLPALKLKQPMLPLTPQSSVGSRLILLPEVLE